MSDTTSEFPVVDAPTARPAGETTSPAATPPQHEYRTRFAIVYGILAIAAVAGIAWLGYAVNKSDPPPAPAWSAWEPTGSAEAKTKQIAERISQKYRLKSGKQLAAALANPPQATLNSGTEILTVPITAIVVRPDASKGQAETTDYDVFDAASSVEYALCGLGQNCAIAEGQPSEARAQLLRREALELSLYTFKYVPEISSVTVALPPRKDGAAPGIWVFLQRKDVAAQLGKPLSETLAPNAPKLGAIPPREAKAIDAATNARLYNSSYQNAQDGSALLILDQVPVAG
jgi:hypothetical protein